VLRLAGLDPDAPVQLILPGVALLIWAADLLQQAPLADRDHAWAICDEFKEDIIRHGGTIAQALAAPGGRGDLAVPLLVLGDRTYACVTGRNGFFDLQAGQYVDGLPRPFLEQVNYNLTALYTRQQARLAGVYHADTATPGKEAAG
jgi:hypothetical protein